MQERFSLLFSPRRVLFAGFLSSRFDIERGHLLSESWRHQDYPDKPMHIQIFGHAESADKQADTFGPAEPQEPTDLKRGKFPLNLQHKLVAEEAQVFAVLPVKAVCVF